MNIPPAQPLPLVSAVAKSFAAGSAIKRSSGSLPWSASVMVSKPLP